MPAVLALLTFLVILYAAEVFLQCYAYTDVQSCLSMFLQSPGGGGALKMTDVHDRRVTEGRLIPRVRSKASLLVR